MYSTAMRKVSRIIFVKIQFLSFLFSTHAVSVSLKCMYHLADGFISRARFLKVVEEQKCDKM